MRNTTKAWIKKHWKQLSIDGLILMTVVGLVLSGIIFLWVSTLDIPDLSSFEQRRVLQSTKIYDRTGEILLYDFHQDVRRTVVPFEDISRNIKNATVAIEDDTFYQHNGVRPLAIIRSMVTNVLSNGSPFSGGGGSTITQQVIKNALLDQDKTLVRKIKEAILAIRLEQVLTKDEILNHYLNESPYGGTIYGVEEASLAFFGKRASDLDLAEAAYLSALPQAPTYYSPYGNHMDELEKRKNLVLERMLQNGFITQEEHDAAKIEEVDFGLAPIGGIRAPHFVFYIREYLAEKYGEESLAERGFKVITTLDYDLQKEAETIVNKYAIYNQDAFNASNASMVAADPKTGELLVMVGSRNYFDKDIDGSYNVALADRQPGSSFKPFVYAEAFSKGFTPETVVFDLETQFSTSCAPDNFQPDEGCYSPENYDNVFVGPISLRNALAQSRNVPAVKTLYLAGIKDSIKLARDMGISTLTNANAYGLTLVLGGGEVKLLDMVNAYSVFADEGVKHDPISILRIEDSRGQVLEEADSAEERASTVLNRNVALQISDILSDNAARTPLYGANSQLYFGGRDVAAKTGTTNDYRDAWILGYTPTIVVGTWAGNNDNSSMDKKISGLIVTPMWRDFMDYALTKRDAESFPEPDRTPSNKPVLNGMWFNPSSVTTNSDGTMSNDINDAINDAHSILFYVNKNDPAGPEPSRPEQDSQFRLWEYPVSLWKASLLGKTVPSSASSTSN
ncbi:penicillin-binding protein [Candidatus Parcubacteria bacterium]|nr:penicillin-binding protein [Candidatus Parcubacteria bacterium]